MFVKISSGPSPDVNGFPTNIFNRSNFSRARIAISSILSFSFATSHKRCSNRSSFKFSTFFRNASYRLSSSPREKRMARSQCFKSSRNECLLFVLRLSSIPPPSSSAASTITSNRFPGGSTVVEESVSFSFLFVVVVLTFANNNNDSKEKPFASPLTVPSFNMLPQYNAYFKMLRKSFECNTSLHEFSITSKHARKSRACSVNCRANIIARRRWSKFGIALIARRNRSG
mmetsp:Transcript_3212/g.9894  ORF Transcript_3212/g.9894 Transcript_3212/m.9894 type:complete len:229 (-) Transcript_3212:860-1546(-)